MLVLAIAGGILLALVALAIAPALGVMVGVVVLVGLVCLAPGPVIVIAVVIAVWAVMDTLQTRRAKAERQARFKPAAYNPHAEEYAEWRQVYKSGGHF